MKNITFVLSEREVEMLKDALNRAVNVYGSNGANYESALTRRLLMRINLAEKIQYQQQK